MRYSKIFFEQCKLSFMSAAIFRANFILMLIQSIINTVLNIVCVSFIYDNVNDIGGWGKNEMMILICTSLVVNQFFRAFILPNQSKFISNINNGSFDSMLLKPIGFIFQINTGSIDISSLISASAPIVIIIINFIKIDVEINFARLIMYIILVLSGVVILSAFMLLLQSLAFIFIKVDGLLNIYYIMMSISEKPKEILSSKWLINAFTFAIPALPIASIPTSILLNKASLTYSLISIIVCILISLLAVLGAKIGIRNYSSASS